MKPLRTAIYGRVSHDEQAKFGFSIENQLDKLNAYAKENNLLLVDEYVDEGFSAGTMKRPELQRLLSDLDRIDLIIFTRLDRFSRNVLDANEMVKLFNKKKVSIKAIEEDISTETADDMFLFNMKVSLAQRELAKGSERINTVFEYKVKQGQPLTGKLPWGYMIEEDANGTKKVIKDKAAEHIINDIFRHFMTYQSVRQTSVYINEKYGLEKVYSTYNKLFKNTMYAGVYRTNQNYCDPYITYETHLMIKELLKRNIKVRKKKNIPYLFTGLMICPKCGNRLHGNYCKKPSGKEYIYYRCNRRSAKLCDDKILHNVNEKVIEEYLLNNIELEIQKYIYDASVKLDKAPKPKINIKEITDEMDRLTLAFRKGRVKEDEYDHDYELLEKQLIDAQKEMPKEKDLTSLEDFLNSGWKNVYETLSREDKRALFRTIIKEITKDSKGKWAIKFLL